MSGPFCPQPKQQTMLAKSKQDTSAFMTEFIFLKQTSIAYKKCNQKPNNDGQEKTK